MNITYGLVEEHYAWNGHLRISYGIAIFADADADGTVTVISAVHDITSDRSRLENLIQRCNDLDLSPIHLEDVIEDFLED